MARRRNPFDLFGDFDEMFEEMLKEFENMGPREHMGGPFFYGFSINQRRARSRRSGSSATSAPSPAGSRSASASP